jgi:hypothetical protein
MLAITLMGELVMDFATHLRRKRFWRGIRQVAFSIVLLVVIGYLINISHLNVFLDWLNPVSR